VRKVVTILFADLIGSTSLQERLDAEATRRVMERYYAAMRGPVEAHRGSVVQLLGDGVMCAFGVPHVAEDDAIRAVRAAVGMQQAFREFLREEGEIVTGLGLRVAVNTGEVVVSDERPQGIGDPLNVAARLQQEAREGDVLVGEATRRLVGEQVTLTHFGTFALKGRSEPVPAYRVVSLERPAGAPAIGFVGREDELRRLTLVYEAAVAAPGARLAVILGSPGLGKSRLLAELARRLGGRATVLTARCDVARGATFAPLADALRTFLQLDTGADSDALRAAIEAVVPADELERGRIAKGVAALMAGTPGSPEETFFVVRRLLAALCAVQPVVLALDDLQWAEPLLLDLTEHLVQWGSGVPLLLLVAARPELRDSRSSLAAPGGFVTELVTLGGLDAGAATRLAANVIGADELPAAIAGRVLAASEGNPLFVGELVRMLVHEGALKREGHRWTTSVALADLEMPPTIQALLAARIERLRPEERVTLERAAVVGRQFSRAAVAQLLPRELGDLDARLESLRRSELIEPDTGWFLGEPALRFHHALIRDAAYRRVLRGTRAELHARFADWIVGRVGDGVEHDETIGWHLEQAHQQLRELGPVDARGRELGERAAKYLAAAGRRALARDDLPVAANLLGRALDRLDPSDPARAELGLDRCESLLAAGDVVPAAAAIAELARFTAGSARLQAWHTCFAGQLAVLTDPQSLHATADAVAAAARSLAAAGDTGGEAKAHSVHALALQRLGKVGACEAALDLALAAARRVRDRRRSNAVLAGAPLAALWGPSPVTRASGRCLDVVRVLRITQGAPAVEAVALRCQAVLEALRGRTDAARRMLASSRRMVEDLGLTPQLLETDVFSGLIDLLEGDPVAAERRLRGAYDGLREHGLGIDAARAAALLARALLAQGRVAEGEALSRESESLAGDDLQAAISWRGARAQALVRRGEHAQAVEFARAAVEIAAATDALLHHADARSSLATALRAAGRNAEADAEERRAIELWEAKGASLLAERARRGVRAPAAVTPARSESPPAVPLRAKVRANAATAFVTRLDAAVMTRDAGALSRLFAERVEIAHHPTATRFGRDGGLARFASLLQSNQALCRHEPLATLGDSLALCHLYTSTTSLGEDDVAPFGAIDTDELILLEVDAGQVTGAEILAEDRLGDALARLYERYAESLSAGPERIRAAATARSVAVLMAPPALEPYRTAFAQDVAWVDHRTLGFGSIDGREALLRGFHSLFESADALLVRIDDVLALEPAAMLVRWTVSGAERAEGGAFEKHFLVAWVFAADGLVTRSEQFDADRIGGALARFEQLVVEPLNAGLARRVCPNAAIANAQRTEAAVAARDFEAFRALFSDGARGVHHPTGTSYEESQSLESYQRLLRAEDVAMHHEPMATLGESLALFRATVSFRSLPGSDTLGPFGAVVTELILLLEVDADGLRRLSEFFALEHLDDAIARLYQLHAESLPHGPARDRIAATAVTASLLARPFEFERYPESLVRDAIFIDHRSLGMGSLAGGDSLLRWLGSLRETADDLSMRVDDVLGLRADALLVDTVSTGTLRIGGGAFERRNVQLYVVGERGRLMRIEWFDPDQVEIALARFEALAAESIESGEPRFANAATRAIERMACAWQERDWPSVAALAAPGFRLDDRRPLVGVSLTGRDFLVNLRNMFDMSGSRWLNDATATRGDSLALLHSRLIGEARGGGPVESEHLSLVEVDARGQYVSLVLFGVEDLDAAHAELDRRYAAGEGAPHAALLPGLRAATQAIGAVGTDGIRPFLPEDLIVSSHRRLVSADKILTRDEYVASFGRSGELGEVATQVRIAHIPRLSQSAGVIITSARGTFAGSEFERDMILVFALDGGQPRSIDEYDVDQFDAALARYQELAAESPRSRFSNAASRAMEQFERAWRERDWEAVAATFVSTHSMDDRRRLMRVQISGEAFLANERLLFEETASQWRSELLATRGERLALLRMRFIAEAGGSGPMAVEMVDLVEVDSTGRRAELVAFDLDSLDAAYAELDLRYTAGEGAPWAELIAHQHELTRAAGSADRAALARLLPDDFTVVNHQRFGGTGERRNKDEYVANIRALDDLGVRGELRLDHLPRISATAAVAATTWCGTREGGEFETSQCVVCAHDGRQFHSWEIFDPDQLDAALARYGELTSESPASHFANAASRTMARFERAWRERDWDGVVATFVPTHQMDDRRRLMRVQISGEEFLANERLLFDETASQWRGELLATRGQRLALLRMRFTAEVDGSGPMAVEMLDLVEVDAGGRRAALVVFDLDSLDEAYAELDLRYAAGEGAPWVELLVHQRELARALGAGDPAALSRVLPGDFTSTNRQRFGGTGEPSPRDQIIARSRSLGDLSVRGDIRIDHLPHISAAAGVAATTWYGTRDGGEFESSYCVVFIHDGRRVHALEAFDPDQLDAALARYEELVGERVTPPIANAATRAMARGNEYLQARDLLDRRYVAGEGAPRIENGATRSLERLQRAWTTHDWDGVAATLAPGFRQIDRRPLMQLDLDRDEFLAFLREVYDMRSSRLESEVLATRGSHWALARVRFEGAGESIGLTEIESLAVIEADQHGKRLAMVRFDAADVDAAYAELDARYAADDPEYARLKGFTAGADARDWAAVSALVAPDFVMHDHRPLGWETLHGAQAWIATMRALVELAPDVRLRIDHFARVGRVSLVVSTWVGTRDGGAFEDPKVVVSELDDAGRFRRMDQYDLAQLELARARFEEFRGFA
jgi:class 3 adenylate cyclase/tetratricopeptide (TPR) repeat protein